MGNVKFRDYFQMFLGASIIYACLFYFFAITLKFFPNIDVEGVRQVLPIFNTTFSMLVGYYFGSSAANKAKDETINALTGNSTSPLPNSSTSKTELTVKKTEESTDIK